MSWIVGSCAGPDDAWLELSDAIVAAATGTSVQTVTIGAGGSGYVVGDILTLTTGTFSIAAQVEVTSVSGGVVDGIRLANAGVYTVAPSSPGATSGGTGTGCTVSVTTANNGWTVMRDNRRQLTTVDSIVTPGADYSVNDVITLAGGDPKVAATLTVSSVGGGDGVTGVTINNVGDYNVPPNDPVIQGSVSPTGGSGATFNLTFGSGEKEVILKGEGGGSDEIYVGWRTFSNVSGNRYNFEFHGMTGFNSSVAMDEQPGVSQGYWDAESVNEQYGCYLLAINTSLNYWLSVTPYRIIGVVKVGTSYFNFYLGWGNRYATANEYPYPCVVAGHSDKPLVSYGQSVQTSGLCDPRRSDTNTQFGPMAIYFTDGAWYYIDNKDTARVCLPCSDPNGVFDASVDTADQFTTATFEWDDIIPASGNPVASLRATPGSEDQNVLIPSTIVFFLPSHQVVMDLDDVYWTSAAGGVQSEDRIIVDGQVYRVFQNCNRSEIYTFLAIKEN